MVTSRKWGHKRCSDSKARGLLSVGVYVLYVYIYTDTHSRVSGLYHVYNVYNDSIRIRTANKPELKDQRAILLTP